MCLHNIHSKVYRTVFSIPSLYYKLEADDLMSGEY